MQLGFLGLGRMGGAMAQRLLTAGHQVTVYDPLQTARDRLAAAGARAVPSIAELALTCGVVLSMLPDDAALIAAALGDGGLAAHLPMRAIHMVCGTHGVGAVRAVAVGHAARDQTLVACHVLGRPDLAAAGKLGLVPAGPAAALAVVRPLFSALGEQVFEAGESPLAATAIKIANNFVLGCAIEAIGEGMALARKYGVDPQVFQNVLVRGLFASTAYQAYGDLIAQQDWERVGATALIGLKDARLAREAADAARVPLPSLEVWQLHLERAISRGEGQLDWAVMAREQFRDSELE